MKRYFFPLLLIALGVVGVVAHTAINDQWAAMYPQDAARQAALAHCYDDDHQFNRYSASARMACYKKYLPPSMSLGDLPMPR